MAYGMAILQSLVLYSEAKLCRKSINILQKERFVFSPNATRSPQPCHTPTRLPPMYVCVFSLRVGDLVLIPCARASLCGFGVH